MSYESILAELPEDFVRKMRNWARGNCGQVNYAMTSAYDGFRATSGYTTLSPNVLGGEVTDVDIALAAVPNAYRQAVSLFWQYEGRSLRWLGKRLHINHETAEARVRQGHVLLRSQLAENSGKSHHYHDLYEQTAKEAALAASRTATDYLPVPSLDNVKIRQ